MLEKALAGCAYNSADWSAIENLHSKDVGTFILLPKQLDSNTLRLPTLAKLYDRKQLALHQICKNTGEYSHSQFGSLNANEPTPPTPVFKTIVLSKTADVLVYELLCCSD